MLSRGPGTGMPVTELSAVAAAIAKRLPGLPRVHVLASAAAVTDPTLRSYLERRGAMADVEGALHGGEIYLFASGIADAARAEHVLAEHEAAHAGLRGMLGKDLDATLRTVWAQNAKVRRAVADLMERDPGLSTVQAIEEVLVDIPTAELPALKGWRSLVGKLVQWLSDHGFQRTGAQLAGWLAGTMTEQQRADLFAANLVRSARAFVARKPGRPAAAAAPGRAGAALSRAAAAPMRPPVGSQAFREWFGRSQVVDEDGFPRVVYHATVSSFDAFKLQPDDLGIHFGTAGQAQDRFALKRETDPGAVAEGRAQYSTIPAYLRIEAPLRLDDLGGWSLPLVRDALMRKLPLAAKQVKKLKSLAEVRAWLQSKGVDGIVYRNTRENDRGPELRAAAAAALSNLVRAFPQFNGELTLEMLAHPAGRAFVAAQAEQDVTLQTSGEDSFMVLSPEQIKSATGNRGTYSRDTADIRLSRAATQAGPAQRTVAERADDIINDAARTPAPIDATFKLLTRVTGVEKGAALLYGLGARLIDRITPERVKAGVVSDYGVPEAVIDQRAMMQGRQRTQLREAGSLLEKLSTLTRAESRVAYEWMSMDGTADPRAYVSLMHGLPEESVKVLQEVQQLIDKLSREAVRLGQLDAEAFERHRFAYLRRSYAKYAAELTSGDKARRARAITILGDQYKGRGMVLQAPMKQVQNTAPDWWQRKLQEGKGDAGLKGERLERLERVAPVGAGTTSLPGMDGRQERRRVLEVAYWPAGKAKPAKYAEWESAGTWEVRDTKGGNLVLWRDFTKDEREKMGEIDEARFAIAKTLQGMIHDVEVGRYLEWLAHSHAKKPGEEIAGQVVEASERYRDTFTAGEWVQVPDAKIPGTSVPKYGKLAGLYLPGPIWNDLRQVVGGRFKPLGETYDVALRMWKISKTALSPAVHTNNVMSNMVMADWHNVTAGHVAKALRITLAAADRRGLARLGGTDIEAAKAIMTRYSDSGGSIGGWATQEIRDEQMEPIIRALEAELANTAAATSQAGQIGVYSAMQHVLHRRFPEAFEALKGSRPGRTVAAGGRGLIDLYQAEDDVFRLAAWLKAKEDGLSDAEAGKLARRSFLDYSINAPWVQALRSTAFPFISFTYRAVPKLLDTAGTAPHKLLKLMALVGALNALGVMLGGGGDDEERKLLPEEKAGRIWGMVPKLIRMPWNDAHGSPVYLDIRRWIPVGDVVDVGAGHAALPILPFMVPGGPVALVMELLANKSSFTGKPITLETDTAVEKTGKVLDYLYKAFAPNVLGLPGTYATQGVLDAATGRTDKFGREMSPAQAVASSFGVKLGSYPADVLKNNLRAKNAAQLAEIDRVMADLKRQRQTNRIDQDEYEQKRMQQREKQQRLKQELAEKVN